MRLTSRWTMATTLPMVMDATAMTEAATTQLGDTWSRSIPSTSLSRATSAAPLGTTDRNAVTGVGLP